MKKLLNTLYVTSSDSYLSLDGENVVVLDKNTEQGRVPLHNLEAIVSFGYRGISPALMGGCAERNISLCFLNPQGKFLARVSGNVRGNVVLRKKQYEVSNIPEICLEVAKNCITGKIFNSRWVLERAVRDHSLQMDADRVKKSSETLQNSLNYVRSCKEMEQLRGYEGEAASVYFGVFDQMILQQKKEFIFSGRNRRPPLDKVNALLSFVYTLLTNMTTSALETVGLDPYVGFMHTDRPGRVSLSLDLIEELRPVMADRFVLSLINRKMITGSDFTTKEDGAILIKDQARKKLLTEWQNKKKEVITHPYLEDKVEWGMVPYVQAMLLARYLRGDLEGYPPFFWK
ncbi:type I-C CRISPR-associated endonuclease Cas1c [Diplocloster agilis]|uniref:CRISPR-associated endonuclease Cas1 n=1 Tax=Diplocloster agilis TaxID=2850323 RepID=A0A949JZ45_9FIRM|nr:type I-C CRISPR-associated endonuclease Cas1c [Diplocloster agilis]MBU9737888.1 type I-C CRISPR-associated endonuclease Cas1c [Diplocloster agilis]MBU9744589.1 type I-C CRISPR-associated endonuclease Cas1c [Diplocloster agilis]